MDSILTFHVVPKNTYVVVKQQSKNISEKFKKLPRSSAVLFGLFSLSVFLRGEKPLKRN